MHRRLRFVVAAFVLSAARLALAEDTSYAIHISRSYQPGQIYDVRGTVDGTVDTTAALNSVSDHAKSINESMKAQITGRIRDAKLNSAGGCSQFTLDIKNLTNNGRNCIRPGSVVIVKYDVAEPSLGTSALTKLRDAIPKFTTDTGDTIPDNAKPLLVALFPSNHRGTGVEDDAIGSNDRHKIGDSWKIRPETAASFFSAEFVTLQPFNISGSSTLKSIDSAGNLQLLGEAVGENFSTPFDVRDFMIENSKATFKITATLPQDSRQPILDYQEVCDAVLHGSSVSSRIKVDVKFHRDRKISFTPVVPDASTAAKTPAATAPAGVPSTQASARPD